MEKVCVNHPESPAVGSCRACEKPVCLMCVHEVHGVSFCSDACGTAYKEVKDWLERPAADEEWNPLAEAKKAPAPARPKPVTSVPPPRPATSVPVPARKPTPPRNPSPPELREAPDTPTPAASPSASNRLPLYLGLAAAALVAIGLFFMFKGSSETATEPIARTLPPAGEPRRRTRPPEPKSQGRRRSRRNPNR